MIKSDLGCCCRYVAVCLFYVRLLLQVCCRLSVLCAAVAAGMLPFVCLCAAVAAGMLPYVAVLYYYCTSFVVCLLLCGCCCRYVAVCCCIVLLLYIFCRLSVAVRLLLQVCCRFCWFFWYVFCRLSVAVRLLLQVCCRCCCIVAVRLLPFVCCYIRTSFYTFYCFMFGVECLYQHGCNYYLSSVFLHNVRIFCHSFWVCLPPLPVENVFKTVLVSC